MSLYIYKTFNFSINKAVTTIKSTSYFVTAPVFIIYDIVIAYKTEKPYKMVTGSEGIN